MEQRQHGFARRAAVGLVTGWSYSVGLTGALLAVIRLVKRVWNALRFVRSRLADGPENYRRETFSEAISRLDLNETDLARQAKLLRRCAVWNFIATLAATISLAYSPFMPQHQFNAFLMSLGAVFVFGSKWLTFHYRYCQLRDRNLDYGFGNWLLNPGRW